MAVTRYYIIRRYNCGTSADTTDILGLTTDKELAKSVQRVFCGYEEVELLDPKNNHLID